MSRTLCSIKVIMRNAEGLVWVGTPLSGVQLKEHSNILHTKLRGFFFAEWAADALTAPFERVSLKESFVSPLGARTASGLERLRALPDQRLKRNCQNSDEVMKVISAGARTHQYWWTWVLSGLFSHRFVHQTGGVMCGLADKTLREYDDNFFVSCRKGKHKQEASPE